MVHSYNLLERADSLVQLGFLCILGYETAWLEGLGGKWWNLWTYLLIYYSDWYFCSLSALDLLKLPSEWVHSSPPQHDIYIWNTGRNNTKCEGCAICKEPLLYIITFLLWSVSNAWGAEKVHHKLYLWNATLPALLCPNLEGSTLEEGDRDRVR